MLYKIRNLSKKLKEIEKCKQTKCVWNNSVTSDINKITILMSVAQNPKVSLRQLSHISVIPRQVYREYYIGIVCKFLLYHLSRYHVLHGNKIDSKKITRFFVPPYLLTKLLLLVMMQLIHEIYIESYDRSW